MNVYIRKIFVVTLWCIAGAGVLALLVAAINYRNNKTCKGYKIEITGPSRITERSEGYDRAPNGVESEGPFISKKEINDLLATAGAGSWKERPTQSFDLRRMESVLEKNVWIRDAQLFFDNNGVLRVNVIEREPVARIFTQSGNSFYIDSSGAQLPLSEKLPVKLPVFTDYPAAGIRQHGEDSTLTVQIRQMSVFIRNDPFWMAQIAQVAITSDRGFELVPTIGNHVIEFGDGQDYEQKFHRLFVFYKEVLSRTGFDKYSKIDVAYAGQVIGTRKGSEGTRYDSLQGMKNIQQLIRTAQQLQADTVRQQNMRPLEHSTLTEQSLTNYDLVPDSPSYEKPVLKPAANHPISIPVRSGPGHSPSPVKTPVNQQPGRINPGKQSSGKQSSGKQSPERQSPERQSPGKQGPGGLGPGKQSPGIPVPKAVMPKSNKNN